ncbi:MAG: hypothetical protein ACRDZ2_06070, partial [Ilumatobacteraceae bacterium]
TDDNSVAAERLDPITNFPVSASTDPQNKSVNCKESEVRSDGSPDIIHIARFEHSLRLTPRASHLQIEHRSRCAVEVRPSSENGDRRKPNADGDK